MLTASGSYTGNGSNPRNINDVGFQPDVVIVKRSDGADPAIIRYSTMATNESKLWNNTAFQSGFVDDFTSTGFTVGANANINGDHYRWFAAQMESADSAVFSYTGDGTDNRAVGSFSFTPVFAMGFSASADRPKWRSDQHSGDSSQEINAVSTTNLIQALNSGSIEVGSGDMNTSARVYHVWVVAAGGSIATAEYTGDGVDPRTVAHGLGATPILTLIQAQTVTAQQMVGGFFDQYTVAQQMVSGSESPSLIKDRDATNVTLDNLAQVNTATGTPLYTLVTFAENPVQVSHDAVSSSSQQQNVASQSWNHTPRDPAGITGALVFVFCTDAADIISGVTYDGVAMTRVPGASPVDSVGEAGRVDTYFLPDPPSTSPASVVVSRTNNATYTSGVAITLTGPAGAILEITGILLEQDNQALTEESVDDGSPGTKSMRYAAMHYGGNLEFSITAGANSVELYVEQRATAETIGVAGEVSHGQGSRPVGFVQSSDDVAIVYLAVRAAPPPEATGTPSLGELTASGVAAVAPDAAGAVDLAELTASGAALFITPITASGDATIDEIYVEDAVAQAQEPPVGDGEAFLGELTASGAALYGGPIGGDVFLPGLTATGQASIDVTASGAVTLPGLTASGTQGVVGGATLGGLTAVGAAAVSTPPVTGDTTPPASPAGGVGNMGGVDICLDIDLGIEDPETGVVTLIPPPVQLRLKSRRRVIHRTPSGYARATTLPGREVVIQWGEAFLAVEDMAALRAYFTGRVNIIRWREPDGTVIRMRTRRDSFKTRWSWATPGFYEPLILTLTEMP